MACLPGPTVPEPALPAGLSLTQAIPKVEIRNPLCCNVTKLKSPIPPLEMPPGFATAGVVQQLRGIFKQVQSYLDAVSPGCPKD